MAWPHKPGFREEVGHRIRSRRLLLDLKQVELGRLVQVTINQIKKYEKGQDVPSALTLLRVARALETTTDFLLGRDAREVALAGESEAAFFSDRTVSAINRRLRGMSKEGRQRIHAMVVAFDKQTRTEE